MENKENIKKVIIETAGEMAERVVKGYNVNLYPVKEGVKITSHKEKRIK